jgi:hypothetical protein
MSSTATEQSTFTRPGFIASGVVVGIIVVVGAVLGIGALTGNDDTNPPPAAAPATPEPTSDADPATPLVPGEAESDSMCGLAGFEQEGSVTQPPADVEWTFLGVTAVPGSPSAGPGEESAAGMRHCFARTAEGALLMAANAAVQGSVPEVSEEFQEYATAEGPGRDAVLAREPSASASAGRLSIAGFRVMEYDGDTALVDIAIRYSEGASVTLFSQPMDLTWQDGDWKLVLADTGDFQYPLAAIPNLAGYLSWSAE